MKNKILLLALFLLGSGFAFGQYEPIKEAKVRNNETKFTRNFYFGVGTGLHYKYGLLGVGFGYRVAPFAIAELNFGMGLYGGKVGLTGIFNAGNKNGWCPTLGLNRSAGSVDIEGESNVVYNGLGYKTKGTYYLDPMLLLTPGIQRQFITKKGNRITMDLGYSIALNKQIFGFTDSKIQIYDVANNYLIVPSADVSFSAEEKAAIQLLSPSGVTIGFSYNFGLGTKY